MQENPRTTPSLWDRLCPELYVFGYQLRDYVSSRVDAAFSAARWAIFGSIRMRLFNTRFNQAISFILPTLASLLQLKYLGNTQTPFTTHPLTMTTAVSTAFGYYCAYIVQLKCSSPRFMLFANCCMALLGNVAVASLASVFFPDPMRPLVYFMTVLVSSAELIREVYQSLFVTDYGHPVPRFFRNLGSPSWFERSGILARFPFEAIVCNFIDKMTASILASLASLASVFFPDPTVITKQAYFSYSPPMKTVGFLKVDIFGNFDEGEAPNECSKTIRARDQLRRNVQVRRWCPSSFHRLAFLSDPEFTLLQ